MLTRKVALRTLLMMSCFAMPGVAFGQNQSSEPESLEEVVITGEIQYRNRTDTVAPELVYDQQFFEQFEPLSVGDQLSRVPGVAFTSDIGERDAPQMRGLGEGFTQVLVNGRSIPGAGNDRTVFVDRIPAEIIDRIEIVRAPSADIDSAGIGGTINIILKDGASLPPGVIARIGGVYDIDNEELGGVGALSISGRTDDSRIAWSTTFDAQQRYNTKVLDQEIFDDTSPGFATSVGGRNLFRPDSFDETNPASSLAVEHQDQIDTRESLDLSFNGDLTVQVSPGHSLRLDAFYLNTERDETEDGINFARDDAGALDPFEVDNTFTQDQAIQQDSYGVSALYEGELSQSWSFEGQFRYAQFLETNSEEGFEFDEGDPGVFEYERVEIDSDDQELSLDGALTFNSDSFAERIGLVGFEFEIGVAGKQKTRDFNQRTFADDFDDTAAPGDPDGLDIFDPNNEETDLEASGNFQYEENRLDAFAQVELGLSETVTFQAGARVETTETEASLFGEAPVTNDFAEFFPSAHLQWDVGANGQIRASVARTARRPSLDQLVPFEDEGSPGDNDVTEGNPNLGIETAWGVDIGYEHRIGQRGIIGINFFHRKVSDLISLISTGEGSEEPGPGDPDEGQVYTFANTGSGTVDGYEIDISTPLTFLGLPETGFFANYTSLDSERTEPLTGITPTFNAQPEYVYNWGVTHNIPSWETSFGFSYRKQGMSRTLVLGEIEDQWYDANLEVFVEHRLSDSMVLRVVGNNLLDADSIQAERGFDGENAAQVADAMINNDVDAFEVERENSSPTVLVSLRAVF